MAEKDHCGICWKETKYDRDTPVDARRNYGPAGQLCEDCGNHLHVTAKKNKMSKPS